MSAYLDLFTRFSFNIISVAILLFVLYYPRYNQKETTISAALFNVFAFAALSILSSVQFSIAAGFGLFAILALFSLRSEQINRTDISYFFGSVSIAVITSIQGTHLGFVLAILLMILVAVYVIDHPRIMRAVNEIRIDLDFIPKNVVAAPEALQAELSERLAVEVLSVRILSINYVTETVRAEVSFRVGK